MSTERVSIEKITPTLAAFLLGFNTENRKIRKAHASSLCASTDPERWLLGPDAICLRGPSFADPVQLINGQHRLSACVSSGHSIRVIVLFGAAREVYEICDRGSRRTVSDALRANGLQHTALTGAVANLLFQYSTGKAIITHGMEPDLALRFIAQWPQIVQCVGKFYNMRDVCGNGSAAVAALTAAYMADPTATEAFAEKLLTGANLGPGHPALHWRNRMLSNKPTSSGRELPGVTMGVTIKAFEAFREGRTIGALRMHPDETFPRVTGCPLNPPAAEVRALRVA
jgi:hypothetical protein